MPETKSVKLSEVIVGFARKRGLSDTTKAGKILRSSIRSNYDHLRGEFAWPPEEKENRDGNRYPPMPESLAKVIVETGKVPAAKKAGE
jgi:hypothetical protein